MLTQRPQRLNPETGNSYIRQTFVTDKAVPAFIVVSLSYLLLGLLFGMAGSMQYLIPEFLRERLSFQQSRPLHVYLVISWIFTAAQAAIYYFLPRITGRKIFWTQGVWMHLVLQIITSISVVTAFIYGKFGGREYLEFPPEFGALIAVTWLPFAINFFKTLKPDYKNAPVYYFSWTTGILFFYITLSESYLWLFDYFKGNEVRDITVQWKALGSMVGSWNMLIYGCSMYLMQQMNKDRKSAYSKMAFFFFFLGFTNLLFNWGHHTYIVPAAPWIKTTAYLISMTELLIFGHIIFLWRKTMSEARRNYHLLPFRLLSFADLWIFLNLALAIFISVPAFNYYTHGTHITVAHAMGATIGINSMLLFAFILYILQDKKQLVFEKWKKWLSAGIYTSNIALVVFWFALIASGIIKILGKLHEEPFAQIMKNSIPVFRLFAASGAALIIGILIMIVAIFFILYRREKAISLRSDRVSSIELEAEF